MGIFDKVKGLLKLKEDKNDKLLSKVKNKERNHINQKVKIQNNPVLTPNSTNDLESEHSLGSKVDLESKLKNDKFDLGLKKTKESFFGKLSRTLAGKSTID